VKDHNHCIPQEFRHLAVTNIGFFYFPPFGFPQNPHYEIRPSRLILSGCMASHCNLSTRVSRTQVPAKHEMWCKLDTLLFSFRRSACEIPLQKKRARPRSGHVWVMFATFPNCTMSNGSHGRWKQETGLAKSCNSKQGRADITFRSHCRGK
jgi:hypothetical protein